MRRCPHATIIELNPSLLRCVDAAEISRHRMDVLHF
jgi:hypothetical protein